MKVRKVNTLLIRHLNLEYSKRPRLFTLVNTFSTNSTHQWVCNKKLRKANFCRQENPLAGHLLDLRATFRLEVQQKHAYRWLRNGLQSVQKRMRVVRRNSTRFCQTECCTWATIDQKPYLYINENLARGKYIALSHCWGGKKSFVYV